MKKFNIICIICMIVMLIGIVYNFVMIGTGTNPIYYRVMLVLDGILFGMAIGECYLGNIVVFKKCNFARKEESDDEQTKNNDC